MLLFIRRVQGRQSGAAKSGNRPRFKPFGQEAEEEDEEEGRATGAHGSAANGRAQRLKSSASSPMSLLLAIVISSLIVSCVNCDHDKSSADLDSVDSSRVAALATRLEQWFICQRLSSLSAAISSHADWPPSSNSQNRPDGEQVPPTTTTTCPAHYDGHLCWPPTRAGQSAKLPCPRLNWLPDERRRPQPAVATVEERHHSAKSVISSIQTLAQANASSLTPESISRQPTARLAGDTLGGGGIDSSQAGAPITQAYEQQQQQGAAATSGRFAYRKCAAREATGARAPTAEGQWQPEQADYSACGPAGGRFDPTDEWINLDQEPDKRLFSSLVEELDRFEASIDPYSDPDLLEQWSLCIGNIMRHQRGQDSAGGGRANGSATNKELWCPIIFDGWRCWPLTRANEIAYVSCPSNQPGFLADRKAHKICTSDGTWYRHPMTNRYWSNYTTCVDTVDLAFRTKILNLYVIGNLISLIALSASLIIFISFKSLNCTRVTIHKNLFLSFITNNLMWIIWYTYVVNDADLLQKNPIECQFWHILLHYFLVSNYFWMFCEGLYLHTLLVVAFVSEDKILKWFYLLGWLTPVPITVAYAYNRSYDETYTSYCWMEESPYNMILMTPIGISLLLNLVFLINIVRVLVTKLRANNSPDTHQTRKAVRATLILIPLLGLHYILTPFRPEAKSEWEGIYESVAAVCTSFQGLCVAMLFCFCNGEVITAIKKKLKDTFNFGHSKRGGHEFMRNRSNTTCTIMGSGNNGFGMPSQPSVGVLEHQHSRATIQSADLPSLPSNLFQNRHSLSSTTNHVNGTNSNTSNSSSLLTTITISPLTTALVPSNCEFSSLLSGSAVAINAPRNNHPTTASGCTQYNNNLQPNLVNQQADDTTIGDEIKDQSAKGGIVREETVRLLQIEPEQADYPVSTTSFSMPM